MKNVLAIALALVASTSFAEPLLGDAVLVEADQTLFDTASFANVQADVYHITVDNPNPEDAFTFSLELPVPTWENGSTFRQTTDLATAGPNRVADSFFVLNAGAPTGALSSPTNSDDENGLVGTVTVLSADPTNGNAEVTDDNRVNIPGMTDDSVVAVLVVPTGTTLDIASFSGEAVIGGNATEIAFIPEPSTALLAGLALVGFVARRK